MPPPGTAVVHRVRERLFDAELRAVEHRPGPAERKHASRPHRVVPDEPRHHRHDRRLGQHEAIRRIVGDQISDCRWPAAATR